MKALLYKEFKLAMHPICYVFIFVFPLMILIPKYPLAVGFIYVLTCYPILFLGANKGQQSNDLLYSTLLPVRKKDIVLARMMTVIIMQFVYIAIMSALYPAAQVVREYVKTHNPGDAGDFGLGIDAYVSVLGIVLVGFAIADLIYFAIYYKQGKSIVASTLLTILGFIVYLAIFTVAIPYIKGAEGYANFLSDPRLWPQFIVLGATLLLYAILHIVVYHVASKELEKVDF